MPSQLTRTMALLTFLVAGCSSTTAPLTDGGIGGTTGTVSGGTTTGTAATGTSGGTGGSTGTAIGTGTGTTGSTGGTSGITGGTSGGTATTGAGTTGGSVGTTGGTGGDGGLLNQPCSVNNGIDPCVAVGLVCMYSTDPAHMGTICVLPGEFSPCQASVGCNDAALQCIDFATGAYCLMPCASSNDCPTLYTSCQPAGAASVCYFDFCVVAADGGTFSSCDASGQGDGTCLPTTGAAICLQGGTAAPGDACSDHRGPDVTNADICAQNAFCIPGGVAGAGHCAPLCGTLDGGTSCPQPTFCQPSTNGDWGYCL